MGDKRKKIFESIELYHYGDGFSFQELNCVGQAIGVCSSVYNEKNYYLYGYLYNMYSYWKNDFFNSSFNFVESNNILLNKLGLKIKVHELIKDDKVVDFIKDKINYHKPIIYLPKRNLIPYGSDYQNLENESLHAILITGYGIERDIILIKDISHLESSGISLNTRYGMFKLYLKSSIVLDMWKDSNKALEKRDSLHYYKNKFFTLEKDEDSQLKVKEYKDLSNIFIQIMQDKSCLIDRLGKVKQLVAQDNNNFDDLEEEMNYSILYLVNKFTVFIDFMKKIECISEVEESQLYQIYLKTSSNTMAIIKEIVKHKLPLNLDLVEELIKEFEHKLKIYMLRKL